MITVREIAQKANVSIATVSMVINNKEGVGDATRQKILAIIEKEGYEKPFVKKPNKLTDKNRTKVIRFIRIAKHGHTVNRDHDIFIADYIDGISEIASKNNFFLENVNYKDLDIEHIIKDLDNADIEGAIILGTELDKDDIGLFEQLRYPIVFIDTYFPYLNFDFIDMDNKDAVHLVLEEFVKNGHTEIGMVHTNTSVENFNLRLSAFKKARAYFHLPEDFLLIPVDSTYQGACKDFREYLDKGGKLPQALFCTNDVMALAVMCILQEKNIKVPEDISIIGFDNLPQGVMTNPPLTTIDVAKNRIGYTAINTLIERINSDNNFPPIKTSIGSTLIQRKSVRNLLDTPQNK
jgi:LacI family transcriptional regulator